MRAHGDLMVALTGAAAPVTVEDRQVAHRSPLPLRDGETLKIGIPAVGLRTYLSVRGGVDVPSAKDRSFPAKASYEEPSRSRPAVSPSCFWPIIR